MHILYLSGSGNVQTSSIWVVARADDCACRLFCLFLIASSATDQTVIKIMHVLSGSHAVCADNRARRLLLFNYYYGLDRHPAELHRPPCDARAAGLLRAQMIVHVISFAFLMVMASTAILSPVLLYVFGLAELGWRWEHAAMFSAIIASTDAVAVSAVLKSGA